MVKSIHNVARVMGKQTVAKYVASAATLDSLRDIGVDFAQGHAIGKAQSMAAFGFGGKLVKLAARADLA